MAAAFTVLMAVTASAEPPALLTDARVRLSFGRYAPSDEAFEWMGWIGAGAGVLRVSEATVYVDADVETILGNETRAFEANQAGYRIEGGVHRDVSGFALTGFFHHVSRHLADRGKDQAVDWNFVGGRAAREAALRGVPIRAGLSLAHTIQDSLVGYRWEAIADVRSLSVGRAEPYGSARVRLVTAEPQAALPRRRFVDVTLEAGARFGRRPRVLETFVSYEHRSDVRLLVAGSHDRVLIGFRLGFDGGDPVSRAPEGPASSPWCSRR